jgi:hypothetical protein
MYSRPSTAAKLAFKRNRSRIRFREQLSIDVINPTRVGVITL